DGSFDLLRASRHVGLAGRAGCALLLREGTDEDRAALRPLLANMARCAQEIEAAIGRHRGRDADAVQHARIRAKIGVGLVVEDGTRINALDRAAVADIRALHKGSMPGPFKATAAFSPSFPGVLTPGTGPATVATRRSLPRNGSP